MGNKTNSLETDFLENIECVILAKTSDTQLVVLKSHMFIQLENGKMEKSLLMHTIPFKHRTIIEQEQIKPEIEVGKKRLLEKFRKFEKERKWTVTSLDETEKVYCARNPLRIYFDK